MMINGVKSVLVRSEEIRYLHDTIILCFAAWHTWLNGEYKPDRKRPDFPPPLTRQTTGFELSLNM